MAYLIDSDVLIYHLNGVPQAAALVRQLIDTGVSMSVITYIEALDGLDRSHDPQSARQRFATIVQGVPIVPLGQPEGVVAAEIRSSLRRQGRSVRSRALDVLIAATALTHDLTLVTNNEADYRGIPGLMIQPATLEA